MSASERTKFRPWSRPNTGLSNTWQILVGVVLTPLGVLFLILGWYGAAHASYVQQQIPYVESGGFIGLGCLILGGLLYWAHWLYRIYDQADLHHAELIRQQNELIRALLAGGSAGAVPAVDGTSVPDAATAFVATPSGSSFHKPDCPIVADRLPSLRTISKDETSSMKPCRVCEPRAGR
jgi:hypothetical protein